MKYIFNIILIIGILISGCSFIHENISKNETTVDNIDDLFLNNQDLQEIGLIKNDSNCNIEKYETSESSPLEQYGFCYYNYLKDNTEIVIESQKFTNTHDLNGSYQYSSLHLRGFEGLINENSYGSQSRFYVNNESDVYYYHLWIVKDLYLIHITSKGSMDVKDSINDIGLTILSKFN